MRNGKFNICVLDGYTLNPGDLSWKGIEEYGNLTVYDRTSDSQIIERAESADIVLVNKVVLKREHFDKLPNLKYIGVLATGYNNIDIDAAKEHNVIVTNIPSYSTDSVAQLVFAHILNIYSNVHAYSDSVKRGDWSNCADFSYHKYPLLELSGKVMGIVGLGHIGMAVAKIALAFGMKVMAYTSKDSLPDGMVKASMDDVFANADVLSLHCPLTDTTRGLVCKERIDRMKHGAVIINTGRGPLVNEKDLAEALNEGRIMAAGVDVLSVEPPKADNPLLSAKNCFLTPHVAWATYEARCRLMKIAEENIRQFVQGEQSLSNRIC